MQDSYNYASNPPSFADMIIIGGGIVGAATAFYATQAGINPIVLEKRSRPGMLTTPVSTGAYRLQFDNYPEMELVRKSEKLFLNFNEITGIHNFDIDIRQQGYLWITTDEEGGKRQKELVERQHRWGHKDIEILDGDEVRYRFPYTAGNALQARFRQKDGFLDPKKLTMGLLISSKAKVVVKCPAIGFQLESERVVGVETPKGTINSPIVVIAAGPFSGLVSAQANLTLPVTTVRRHKLIFPEVLSVPPWAPMTIDEDTGAHWRPWLRGACLLLTDPNASSSPPTDNVPTDYRFYDQLLDPHSPNSVSRIAPFWEDVWSRNTTYWILQAGQYTETPDHKPLIGESKVPGLYLNTGYSGHGIMASPGGSQLLIKLITGEILPSENPFQPDRKFSQGKQDIL